MTEIRALIDSSKITPTQYAVFCLCFLLNALDGMDVLVISYAAPQLMKEWSIAPEALGLIFSAGLLGMTLGAMFLAPIADRVGRRNLILVCVALVGSGVLATAVVQSIPQLIGLRFASGLGIGALLASSATLAAEYSPDRARNLIVSGVTSGYPIGATVSGLAAAQIIPSAGWRVMFVTAGVATLLTLPLLWWRMPESIGFLIRLRPKGALEKLNRILGRMGLATLDALPQQPQTVKPGSVVALFEHGRATSTTMLWLAFFAAFFTLYFLISWIPNLAANTGLSLNLAIYAGTVFNLGAFFGIWLQGYLSMTVGLQRTIAGFMVLTAVLMCLFGLAQSSLAILLMFGCIGFAVQGGFVGLYTVAARLYPTEVRNTGVGWGIGAGRVGAVFGPIAGGILIGTGMVMTSSFIIFAVPMVLAGVFTMLVRSRDLS